MHAARPRGRALRDLDQACCAVAAKELALRVWRGWSFDGLGVREVGTDARRTRPIAACFIGGLGVDLAGLPISWTECSGFSSGLRHLALKVGSSPPVLPGTQGDVEWAGVTYRLRLADAQWRSSTCGQAQFFLSVTDAVVP